MIKITSKIVLAYSNCPRKAYLLLFGKDHGRIHEYLEILEQQAMSNRACYIKALQEQDANVEPYSSESFKNGCSILIDATLSSPPFEAYCDIVTKIRKHSSIGKYSYEPSIIVGTCRIADAQKLELAFAGHVLDQMQVRLPETGIIIDAHCRPHRLKLEEHYKKTRTIVHHTQKWLNNPPTEAPPIVLNNHCPYCQYREQCRKEAEADDNLSLLAHMNPKTMQRYHKKGIFTVHQLSFLFKPRRRRKRRNKPHTTFNVELQALAIRTNTIYIQKLPEIERNSSEIFLDIEGVPDQNFQYLIGLIAHQKNQSICHSLWADNLDQQEQIWKQFLTIARHYSDAPIYHYGQYEFRAIERLANTYGTTWDDIHGRLVNLNAHIYGQVYFPTLSNTLKDIGRFLGATWSDPDATGLQSLVWRHRWEKTEDPKYKQLLLTYNEEDCRAVQNLVEKLAAIASSSGKQTNVDFADRPKEHASERGTVIHDEFERLLKSAHADYKQKRFSLRKPKSDQSFEPAKKLGALKGHQAYQRLLPSMANRVIRVAAKRTCPTHRGLHLIMTEEIKEKFIIDLRFTRNGCRKIVTKYVGKKAYCEKCNRAHDPPTIKKLGGHLFGHSFKAWAVYQRVVLRLPYYVITQVMEGLFGERTTPATIVNFMREIANFYSRTELLLIKRILESPFVHVDETRINIQGHDRYVWVFTDGMHVVFRLTETRECTVVKKMLAGYKGVLVSDFYPGYDTIPCLQQKCLVHLIRDINDDLWRVPYDTEFEGFVLEVKNLFLPIFDSVDRYGLKKRHLGKFDRNVEKFYKQHVNDREYKSEASIKFQKRFVRYRECLFAFLHHDGVPWNNNTGERGIRHLAIQRKISGTFFENAAPSYLLLLGMAQTCRFQGKSFLRFLISGGFDINAFKANRQLRISKPVGPS